MASVTMVVPDDLLVKLQNGRSEPGETLRLAAAFSLCSRGELSTSQAARLAGLTYVVIPEAAVVEIQRRGPADPAVQALTQATWLVSVDPGPIPANVAAFGL